MSLGIEWQTEFYGISWAYELDRLVISLVFEDKRLAASVAGAVERWSSKFTRLTIIEMNDDEFAMCCYQDPQVSRDEHNIGLFRTGMKQRSGYGQAKSMILERSPLVQIAYAADVRDMGTYEQVSKLIPIRKCRIIHERELKKQEYYYEKQAIDQSRTGVTFT